MTLASSLVERPDMVIPGKNGTGSDIAEKLFVTGYNDAISLPAANTDPILGVTMAGGAKNGKYGSVMTRGLAIITCAGSVTKGTRVMSDTCLLYTSDAADERSSVDLGGRRIIKK